MQNIPPDFILNVVKYGYLIIIVLVFLQEVGFPNPIPNELVMVFSGYLGFAGLLKVPFVILAAMAGDLFGSSILYAVFYFFGKSIMEHKPRWLPISQKKIDKLSANFQRKGISAVIIGRLAPFIRGYVSVLMGMMNYPARKYAWILSTTAVFWACFYVLTGYLIGPYWKLVSTYKAYWGLLPVFMLLCIGFLLAMRQLFVKNK
jgi:membrane protein DedA with SNARE-associated domain